MKPNSKHQLTDVSDRNNNVVECGGSSIHRIWFYNERDRTWVIGKSHRVHSGRFMVNGGIEARGSVHTNTFVNNVH